MPHTFTNTLRLNNQSYKRISCNESKKCLLKKTFTGYWKIALLQLTVETILIIAFFKKNYYENNNCEIVLSSLLKRTEK